MGPEADLHTRSQQLPRLVRATGGNPLAVIETLARRNAFPVAPEADAGGSSRYRGISAAATACVAEAGAVRGYYPLGVC